MLLTLKPSQQHGYANPYAYSPAQRSPSSYYSSPPKSAPLPPLPDSEPRRMSTPHRGLPPPSVMERSLPLPDRAQAPSSFALATLPGALPAAPPGWQGHDESMRSWLSAKSEEDRRRQEEEKTRQEDLRLQQRRIEQNMLQESLRGHIPPHLIPVIFASIGGSNIANLGVDYAQQYMASLQLNQQQQQIQQQAQIQQHAQQQQQQQQVHQQLQAAPQSQPSPEQRRDTRMITGPNPNPYGAQQMQPPAQSAPAQQSQPASSYTSSYSGSSLSSERIRAPQTLQAAPPTSNPRPSTSQTSLSRLNTGDMHQTAPPGSSTSQLSGQHPLQQAQSTQGQDQPSSPGLYFHHWQPPDSQGKSKDKDNQGSSSGKSHNTSPNNPPPGSHLRSEYTTSPKKRKATGSHQAAPTPSSHTSPSFSHQGSSGSASGQRRRHSRTSDTSSHSHSRAAQESGRQSFSETENGSNSAHPGTHHAPHQHAAGSDSREMREIRRVSRDLSERSSPKRES